MINISSDIQGVIFDCDGTLTDSMPVHFLAWRQTMGAHGIDFTEERFYAMGGMPSDRIIRTLSDEHGMTLDSALLADEKEASFVELMTQVTPVTKVVEVVRQQQRLRERGERKLAVASGGYRWVVDRQLEHIGLAGCFDAIVTAEDTERHKPHPDVFLEAARRMGVEATACLVFEDSDLGVEAAGRAEMQVVDVRLNGWGSSSV